MVCIGNARAEPDTGELVFRRLALGHVLDGVNFLHDHKGPPKQPSLATASGKIPTPFCGYNG